jgi:hypothetical protein
MASQATAMALKDLFTYHFAETREHKIRLETAFDMMNVNGKAVKSESMAAILDEQQGEKDIYDNEGSGVILDAEVIFMTKRRNRRRSPFTEDWSFWPKRFIFRALLICLFRRLKKKKLPVNDLVKSLSVFSLFNLAGR